MVDQIANVFPQYSRASVTHAVRLTGSVDLAVNFLLEHGNNVPAQQAGPIENETEGESSESDNDEIPIPNAIEAAITAFTSSPHKKEEVTSQDTWFSQKKRRIIEECRR